MPKEKVKKKPEESEVEDTDEEETEVEDTEDEEVEETPPKVEAVKKKAVKIASKMGVPKKKAENIIEEVEEPEVDDSESLLAYMRKIDKRISKIARQLMGERELKKEEPEETPEAPPKPKTFSEWWDSL